MVEETYKSIFHPLAKLMGPPADIIKIWKNVGKKSLVGLKSQSELVPLVFILSFVLSSTFIFAYQNISSSFTLNESHVTDVLNEISSEIETTTTQETTSTTIPENTTTTTTQPTSTTIQETTATLPENTTTTIEPPPTEEKPTLNITIQHPEKITRGEIATVRATVTNTGSLGAKNVVLVWQLPLGFEIISDEKEKSCGNLEPSASCITEITVSTSFSSELGKNKIKVVVSYE